MAHPNFSEVEQALDCTIGMEVKRWKHEHG